MKDLFSFYFNKEIIIVRYIKYFLPQKLLKKLNPKNY